jgi:hypothetical protein
MADGSRSSARDRPEPRRGRIGRAAWTATRGLSALGWAGFVTIFCFGCSGLPVLAGLFGGLAVGTRFGVSAGIAATVVFVPMALRARRRRACPALDAAVAPAPERPA